MNHKKGFTLIELMVVIAIIGLLSSIVLASLAQARAIARDNQREQGLIQIRNALALYALDHNGTYPANSDTGPNGGGDWTPAFKAALVPKYISSLPVDPVRNTYGPIYQYYLFMYCNTNNPNNCQWYNTSQQGQVCPGQYVLIAYGTEGKVKLQQCQIVNQTGMTVLVSD